MPRSTKSADTTHGGGTPITKRSGSANITPPININPDLSEKHGDDIDDLPPGAPIYPQNGGGLTDPVG